MTLQFENPDVSDDPSQARKLCYTCDNWIEYSRAFCGACWKELGSSRQLAVCIAVRLDNPLRGGILNLIVEDVLRDRAPKPQQVLRKMAGKSKLNLFDLEIEL